MDVELFAWRRLVRVWPLVALLLLMIPAVREWLGIEAMERAFRSMQYVNEAVLQPVLENVIARIQALFEPAPAAP